MNDTREIVTDPGVINVLVANHKRFQDFLRPRVRTVEDAEEILQTAFVKATEKGHAIRDDERAVAWFYRLLRNSLIDYYRRQGTEQRAMESLARDAVNEVEMDIELDQTLCACLKDIIVTLKPEYAEMIQRVDLDGESISDASGSLNITANNATVRLHRARTALRDRLVQTCGTCTIHGCLNCTCQNC
jgi:RNA polymerase sigma factor (sigma-70 family)